MVCNGEWGSRMSNKLPALQFYPGDWLTPRTYSSNYQELRDEPAIYALVDRGFRGRSRCLYFRVLYIGQSVKLKSRLATHPLFRELRKDERFQEVVPFFQPCEKRHLRKVERKFIRGFNPPFNLQCRTRGL